MIYSHYNPLALNHTYVLVFADTIGQGIETFLFAVHNHYALCPSLVTVDIATVIEPNHNL